MPFFILHSHLTLILLHKSHLFCLHVRCQIRASYFTNSVCLTISVCSSRKVIIILEVTAGFPQIVFFHISLCHLTSHLICIILDTSTCHLLAASALPFLSIILLIHSTIEKLQYALSLPLVYLVFAYFDNSPCSHPRNRSSLPIHCLLLSLIPPGMVLFLNLTNLLFVILRIVLPNISQTKARMLPCLLVLAKLPGSVRSTGGRCTDLLPSQSAPRRCYVV